MIERVLTHYDDLPRSTMPQKAPGEITKAMNRECEKASSEPDPLSPPLVVPSKKSNGDCYRPALLVELLLSRG